MAADVSAFVAALTSLQSSGALWQMIKRLSDGVHEGSVIAKWLTKLGGKPWNEGGDFINWNIVNVARRAEDYYGAQTLDTSTAEFMAQCTLIRSYITMHVTYYMTDLSINSSSKLRFTDYVATQIDNMKMGFGETLDLSFLGTSTARADGVAYNGAHHIYGLQYWIQDTPGTTTPTTIAGQTRSATTTWLNNQSRNIASLAALTTSDLHRVMARCTHGTYTSPNLILCSDTGYRKIWNLAKGENWYRPSKTATDLGFPDSIQLGGASIVPCKAMTGTTEGGLLSADLDNIFFLNLGQGMCLYQDPSDNMKLQAPRIPTNQHIIVQHTTWNGQLIGENPRLLGQIYW